MSKEYYWEYMKACDDLVTRFLCEGKRLNKDAFKIQHLNIEKAIMNYLWEKLFFNPAKELFSKQRSENNINDNILESLWDKILIPLLPEQKKEITDDLVSNRNDPYEEILNPYKHSTLFYCKNNRQLKYLLPILQKVKIKSVIISMQELNETIINNDNVEIIEFNIITHYVLVYQNYLKEKLRQLFFLTNTFFLLIKNIMPARVIVLEGCHFEQEIIAAVCKSLSIKTICIQQGWPGLVHTRFSNMGYDYFFTWGKAFSKLWEENNPHPKYIETGYLYEVNKTTLDEKGAIAFFFQSPSFTISNDVFHKMLDFASFCAETFPERRILIREHPEYRFMATFESKVQGHANIELVTDTALAIVFSKAIVGVSIFSSTLVEGLAHQVIPFAFNLTSSPKYYPDLAGEELGVEVKDYEEAKQKITELLNNVNLIQKFRNNILNHRKNYFKYSDRRAVEETIKVMMRII